uniref:Uncharacterized protein n=1 Tax=Alexandrium catenella TaxID=2925 RepID=A0A7S1PQV9_ALECA
MPVLSRAAACLAALHCAAALHVQVAPGMFTSELALNLAKAKVPASTGNASAAAMVGKQGSKDGFCDMAEGFWQAKVKSDCKVEGKVTCVYVKFPQCSAEDICQGRNGCGYVQDNNFVKFTGYSCKGNVGFGAGEPSGDFQLNCSPALTPIAVVLIVIASFIVVGAFMGCFWFCCRK